MGWVRGGRFSCRGGYGAGGVTNMAGTGCENLDFAGCRRPLPRALELGRVALDIVNWRPGWRALSRRRNCSRPCSWRSQSACRQQGWGRHAPKESLDDGSGHANHLLRRPGLGPGGVRPRTASKAGADLRSIGLCRLHGVDGEPGGADRLLRGARWRTASGRNPGQPGGGQRGLQAPTGRAS